MSRRFSTGKLDFRQENDSWAGLQEIAHVTVFLHRQELARKKDSTSTICSQKTSPSCSLPDLEPGDEPHFGERCAIPAARKAVRHKDIKLMCDARVSRDLNF